MSGLTTVLDKSLALHYQVVPYQEQGQLLSLYCNVGVDTLALQEELEVVLNRSVSLKGVDAGELERLLSSAYLSGAGGAESNDLGSLSAKDDFLTKMIMEARRLHSSDIHIEAFETRCRVRIRIDGLMVERYQITVGDYPALVNKIKIQANLDIAEKRLPQDGRIHYKGAQEAFDIRVSVLPTLHGEKVVLRLLNSSGTKVDLESLGLDELDLENYLMGVKKPHGIILISGPTGSGKTTTLYATLKLLNQTTRNVLTIEDPIEYTLEGINQVQLKESIGLDFAAALRTFLRQDPDVIMVGEIRDAETANMAIRAALTGHLVLSTIHTNSAWGTISRLTDMGIPDFLVANTLNTSVAQRLVRLLCPSCATKEVLDAKIYPKAFHPPYTLVEHARPVGCAKCFYTGYKGRKAVYEVVPIDFELSEAIKAGQGHVGSLLEERGIKTLSGNAFTLFAKGLTSIEEIYPLLMTF